MAKFCTNCGKELVDGNCPKCGSKATNSGSQKSFGKMLGEYWELVKKTLSKPVTILKENSSEDNFCIGLISMCVSGILAGLFICLLANKTLSALFGGLSGFSSSSVDIPYVKIFLVGFIFIAGMLAIQALIGYIVFDKMFKANTSIKKMFVLFGIATIVESLALAGCCVLTFLELSEGVMYCMYGLIAVASILSIVYVVKAIDDYAKIDSDKLGYALAIVYVATAIATYFVANNVLPSIL